MSTVQGPWPGRFVWHDLMTTDAARVVPFYTALFGWRLEERPMAGFVYRMIHCGPGPIGGIVEEKAIPTSHWMPYLAVDDVDATHNKVQTLGGAVCVPPTDIPATGRFAVVADPQGAYVSLFQGRPESPGCDPDLAVPGRICWNELLTGDDLAAQRFYSSLVGWRDAPKDMGPFGTYRVQTQRGKQACGIMKNPENGAPSSWLAYFLAPDLAASTQRAAQLGARVMMANQPIPGIGAFSLLADPAGAVFALFQPATTAAPC
ncbi:MAG: VOC family protein [Planctomycetes bacterium]|nr:VOC family protein [Planctomycetota bacterium]